MKKQHKEQLMPKGIPRYIRIYDNEGNSFDRYTCVYTKKRTEKGRFGEFLFVSMNDNPFNPQGFGQHGFSDKLIDKPSYKYLGKKITFNDLPEECKRLVLRDYKDLWNI